MSPRSASTTKPGRQRAPPPDRCRRRACPETRSATTRGNGALERRLPRVGLAAREQRAAERERRRGRENDPRRAQAASALRRRPPGGRARGSAPRTSRARPPRGSRDRPGARSPELRHRERVRDQRDVEAGLARRRPRSATRRRSRPSPSRPGSARSRRSQRTRKRTSSPVAVERVDAAGAVDVALHDVAVEPRRRRASRARGSRARPTRRSPSEVRSSVSRTASKWSRPRLDLRHREAGAVHGDAVADPHAVHDARRLDHDARPATRAARAPRPCRPPR